MPVVGPEVPVTVTVEACPPAMTVTAIGLCRRYRAGQRHRDHEGGTEGLHSLLLRGRISTGRPIIKCQSDTGCQLAAVAGQAA
jgi:hypothetical protein